MADQFRLRLTVIDGTYTPELRCGWCGTWWLIDTECWEPNEWHMCLACKRMRAKLYAAMRQHDAEYRDQKKVASSRYRKWLRENHPTYLQAYERERRSGERRRSQQYRDRKKEQA